MAGNIDEMAISSPKMLQIARKIVRKGNQEKSQMEKQFPKHVRTPSSFAFSTLQGGKKKPLSKAEGSEWFKIACRKSFVNLDDVESSDSPGIPKIGAWGETIACKSGRQHQ